MATIPMTGGFTLVPEGTHIFRIYKVDYNEDFGKVVVHLVNAQGITHRENFSLMNGDGTPNDRACSAFSFFAKTALNNFAVEAIEHTDIVNHYIKAEVVHTKAPSTKDPTKTVTFVNLGDKAVAEGFDVPPVPKALTLGTEQQAVQAPVAPPAAKSGLDLDSLLG